MQPRYAAAAATAAAAAATAAYTAALGKISIIN